MAHRCAIRSSSALLTCLVLIAGCASRGDGADVGLGDPSSSTTVVTVDERPAPASVAADLGLLASADLDALACIDGELADAAIDDSDWDAWPGDPAVAEGLFSVAIDCLEAGTGHPIMVEHLERTLERLLGWSIDIDPSQADCAMTNLVERADRVPMALGVRTPDTDSVLGRAAGGCLTGSQADALRSWASDLEGPVENGRVVQLVRGCSSAYRQECDLLRLLVPEGPGTELAAECGGSPPSATGFCAIEFDLDLTGYSPPSNPGLVTLENSCRDGRLNSCDSLRAIAPVGSPLVELGRTCAGLVPEGAVPDCRGAFKDGRSE